MMWNTQKEILRLNNKKEQWEKMNELENDIKNHFAKQELER
jgi:hypothetical protein